jgi:lysophospholipase L1-like esterase
MPDDRSKKGRAPAKKVIGRGLAWARYDDLIVPVADRPSAEVGIGPRYLNVFDPGPSPCLIEADRGEILAEGDSWFCLSIYGNQVTMVQHLSRLGYQVSNISRYSRTVAQVFARRDDPTGYRTRLNDKPKAFLLSAGGNDFLGETIPTWLKQRSSSDHDPANAAKYVNKNFANILASVKYTYKKILDDVAEISPGTRVALQTYTYGAVPTHNEGMHLGRYFKDKGFEPINPDHRELIDAIVKLLIDRFEDVLSSVRRKAKVKVEIVDFRTTLSSADMRDEIHPKSKMAPAMAKAYLPFLQRAGVTLPS